MKRYYRKKHRAIETRGVWTDANLSLVRARASVQVEEAVAVGAEVSTHVAQDDGRCLAVVVVVTHGLCTDGEETISLLFFCHSTFTVTVTHHLLLLSVFAHPAAGGQPVDVVLVQHAQRS